jgi:hypothetical protein
MSFFPCFISSRNISGPRDTFKNEMLFKLSKEKREKLLKIVFQKSEKRTPENVFYLRRASWAACTEGDKINFIINE